MTIPKETTLNDDNFYPTMGIETNASIKQIQDGWAWTVSVHILGPDDVLSRTSHRFATKRAATLDMLTKYESVVNELMKEFGV